MKFTTSSKYSVLTPYMLMEFMYADSPNPENYNVNIGNPSIGYNKMVNGYMNDEIQIFNPKINLEITNNTTENSVIRIDESSFISLDSNLIIPFNDFDDALTSTINLPVLFSSNINVVYDTIRFHIRAGYNLNNLDGLINSIKYEDQDGTYVTIASILIKKGTQQVYTLNTSPIHIGSDIYDKYIEIKIPNLLDMQNKYNAAIDTNKPFTLAGMLSKSGTGFNSLSPIRIFIDEVNSISDYNGYPKYRTVNKGIFSLEQENPFKNIGAVIKPSDNGEFFEFFATDDGGFIEDFILFQNSIGNSYFIYNQIEVIEQIGTAFIETSNFSNNQTNAYDVPNLFRPIIRNSSVAASFTLRYTMSLVNNKDNTRIIRISSYTSNSPGKYGTRITPLQISEIPVVHKIYNKVYDQPSIKLNQIVESSTVVEVIKYANVFLQQMNVTAAVENLRAVSNNDPNLRRNPNSVSLETSKERRTEVIYGRGKGIIKILPFDNYIKFTFYIRGSDGIPNVIDLATSGDYKLVFIDNKGGKLTIPSLVSKNIANPAKGEIAFLIEESLAEKILTYSNENYYISNMPLIENHKKILENNKIDNIDSKEAGYKSSNNLSIGKEAISQVRSELNKANADSSNGYRKATKKQIINYGSSSVLYRGIWKPDINEEIVSNEPIEETEDVIRTAPVMEIPLQDTEEIKTPSVKVIEPEAGSSTNDKPPLKPISGTNPPGNTRGSNPMIAVAGLINSFQRAGWTYMEIYNYFMIPGNDGYIAYPNLTLEQFETAASGILPKFDSNPPILTDNNGIPPGGGGGGNHIIKNQ